MKYDTRIHMQSQLEIFIEAIRQGNIDEVHNTLNILKNIFNDENFDDVIDSENDKLFKKVKPLEENINVVMKNIEQHYSDYCDTILKYVLDYSNNVDIDL